jgi:hypothetical protein
LNFRLKPEATLKPESTLKPEATQAIDSPVID